MKLDLSLEGIKNASTKLLSAVSHFHFVGEMLEAALGHKMPDDAHKLAKLVSKMNAHTGGKDTFVDEAKMVEIKLAGIKGLDGNITASELKMLRELEGHINREYGDGFFGNIMRDRFGNKLRPGLLHMTTDSKDVVDKITRVVGKKTVQDDIVRTIIGDDKLLKKYLRYLVREMREVTKATVGTEEEKALAGYRRGLALLKDDGFPALQFAEFAKMADAAIEAFPDAAQAVIRVVREKIPELANWAEALARNGYAAIEPKALAINQAVIDRSDRIDARSRWHPLRLFGW